MEKSSYRLVGTVHVPSEKKGELNGYVVELLRKCGIRKTEEIALADRRVKVVSLPEQNEEGILTFDYSVFDGKKRVPSTYNTHTCVLDTPDCGYTEFGLAMNIIMVLLESYSDRPCYFMYEDKPSYPGGYASLVEDLLGIRISFPNRARLWELMLFLRDLQHQDIQAFDLWNTFPYEYSEIAPGHFSTILAVEEESLTPPEEPFQAERSRIPQMLLWQRRYYAYQIFLNMLEGGQEYAQRLREQLRELLEAGLQFRQELAGQEDEWGILAEISLYELPPILVQAYAWAQDRDFWEVWDELGVHGYHEIIRVERENKPVADAEKNLRFYKTLKRDFEDEFIEFWGEEEREFSDELRECFEEWRNRFDRIGAEETAELAVEQELADIILRQEDELGLRYVDKRFVTEFLEHSDDEDYKKALFLYKELLRSVSGHAPTEITAYQSLLINPRHRKEILGF